MESPNQKTKSSLAARRRASGTSRKLQKTGVQTSQKQSHDISKPVVIKFSVYGNGQKLTTNPLPKLKMTGRQHWTPRAQQYVAYKAHVVASLIDATRDHPAHAMILRNSALKGKPFDTAIDLKGHMDILIHWSNDVHGDPENIFGAIADSLFGQDKYLDGSFSSKMSEDKYAKVEVTLSLAVK